MEKKMIFVRVIMGVVSEIISGKRQLNVRQLKLLGKRFKVSPIVFV